MNAGVSPQLRFLRALEDLRHNARQLSRGREPAHGWHPERRWLLALMERSLREAGGVSGLSPEEQAQAHRLGREICDLDRHNLRRVEDDLNRLRHGEAERAHRATGGLRRGMGTDRRT